MAGIISFVPVFGQTKEVQQLSNNVGRTLDSVTSRELLNGIVIPNVLLVSGSTTIFHRLGRVPNGYLVTSRTDNASIWNAPLNNVSTMTLITPTATTCSLWVF